MLEKIKEKMGKAFGAGEGETLDKTSNPEHLAIATRLTEAVWQDNHLTREELLDYEKSIRGLDITQKDIRSLMLVLPAGAHGLAGQRVARVQKVLELMSDG